MIPQTLQEFAEDMRRKGDIRDTDLADEILELLDVEEEVAEPYFTLCDDLANYISGNLTPEKAVEWLGDRSNLLAEIEMLLEKAGHTGDVDDAVKELLGTLAEAEEIMKAAGWPGDGDFLEALREMTDPVARMEYDL